MTLTTYTSDPILSFADRFRPIIEAELDRYLTFEPADSRYILEEAMKYSVMAGGKRIRSVMVIASHTLFSDQPERIFPLACAMEMVHTYSLIHDDLPAMDNDDFRRGMPTCHRKFGEDVAILAGDTLNSLCFEIMLNDLPIYFEAKDVIAAVSKFANACGLNGMAGGQVMDLKSVTLDPDTQYLYRTHALKTGALIKASIELPAILSGADQKTTALLSRFGDEIGLIFQIKDDILDVEGDPKKIGKTLNKDVEQNKLTFVRQYGIDGAKHLLAEHTKKAHAIISEIDAPNAEILNSLVEFIQGRTS